MYEQVILSGGESMVSTESRPTSGHARRGFAAMDPERQRELASRGGRASHAKGTGHEWDREAARDAGRKGGIASGITRGTNKKKHES